MEYKCPECSSELVEALCENPSTGDRAELLACECGFRGRKAEVYSRVCGYLRPVSSWNLGKQEEFNQRSTVKI
jgi:anaerobic ribonucleoside-triphosphate reductase